MATERPQRKRRRGRGLLALLLLLLVAAGLIWFLLGGRIAIINPSVDVSPGRLPEVDVGPESEG